MNETIKYRRDMKMFLNTVINQIEEQRQIIEMCHKFCMKEKNIYMREGEWMDEGESSKQELKIFTRLHKTELNHGSLRASRSNKTRNLLLKLIRFGPSRPETGRWLETWREPETTAPLLAASTSCPPS